MNRSSGFLARDLEPHERNLLLELDRELTRISNLSDGIAFVLGSYDDTKRKRLSDVGDCLENWCHGDVHAVPMDGFLSDADGDIQGHLKFKIIATKADVIVGVLDDDRGGFTYEQAIIAENPDFFSKTYVLKRSYPTQLEHSQYNWMQATSFFDELDRVGRLYEWTTDESYDQARNRAMRDIDSRFFR